MNEFQVKKIEEARKVLRSSKLNEQASSDWKVNWAKVVKAIETFSGVLDDASNKTWSAMKKAREEMSDANDSLLDAWEAEVRQSEVEDRDPDESLWNAGAAAEELKTMFDENGTMDMREKNSNIAKLLFIESLADSLRQVIKKGNR